MPMALKTPETAGKLPAWWLLTTAFITGAAVMMIEVVGTRVVGPFFGVGLYVWSALITVTLLALAGGYWVGGKWADRRRDPDILYWILCASALLLLAVPWLRYPLLSASSHLGIKLGALVGGAALFGPALFGLGMVTPYTTKLYTDSMDRLGVRVGLLYAVSTLGSFLGTLVMGYYLIPMFQLPGILTGLGLGLLALPIGYYGFFRTQGRALAISLLVLAIGVGAARSMARPVPMRPGVRVLHKSTSFYGELKVIETNGQTRILLLDGISQSAENAQTGASLPAYIKDMDTLIRHFGPGNGRVLLIGLGGGNLVHPLLERGVQVDVAEIDQQVVNAAERYFGVDPQQVRITLDDGRHFVRQTRNKYSVVVMNAFIGENTPTHLLAKEFFQEVKRILEPGGIVLVNFVGYVQGPHREGPAALYATLKASHTWARVYFRDTKDKFSNILYVAGDEKLPQDQDADPDWTGLSSRELVINGWEFAPICTDDYNPIDFLNRVAYRRWRQLVIDSLGPEILLN